MPDIAKKCIVVGIIKDLYEQGLLTEEEMNLAIRGINEEFERRIWKENLRRTYIKKKRTIYQTPEKRINSSENIIIPSVWL